MENFRPYNFKEPVARAEQEETGPGKKALIFCSQCGIVYYQKSWHHTPDHFKGLDKPHNQKEYAVSFTLCPACEMIKHHQYEGRIVMEAVPEQVTKDLDNLIINFCERAHARDPLDRLIAVTRDRDRVEVTLTENQLANRLAHKIKETFHAVKTHISYAGNPSDVAEIKIIFS